MDIILYSTALKGAKGPGELMTASRTDMIIDCIASHRQRFQESRAVGELDWGSLQAPHVSERQHDTDRGDKRGTNYAWGFEPESGL